MTIAPITDGESVTTATAKMNAAIAAVNAGAPFANPITYTGTPTGLNVTVTNQAINLGDLAVSGLVAETPGAMTVDSLTALGFGAVAAVKLGGEINSTGLLSLNFGTATAIIGVLSGTCDALTSLTAASLVTLTGNFYLSFNALTSLSLPAYVKGDVGFTANSLTSLSLPLFENDNGRGFQPTVPILTSISLPSIKHIDGGLFMSSALELTTFTLGAGLLSVTNDAFITNAKLNQASVNGILVRLAALDGTGGTTSFDNQTVNLSGGSSASPSGAGLTAKTTLEGRGNTVTVN